MILRRKGFFHEMEKPKIDLNIASITSPQSITATPFNDSPILNYINNLYPIKPVKGSSATQVLSGFSSLPLFFTSPRTHAHRQSFVLKSSKCHGNLKPLKNSSLKNHEDAVSGMTDSVIPEGSLDHEGNLSSCPEPVGNDGKICIAAVKQHDERVAQLPQQPVFGYDNDCGKGSESRVANRPIMTIMERHSKVGQTLHGKRRRLQFEAAQEKVADSDQNPSNTATKSEVLESSVSQSIRNSSKTVSKPSGIGLHLNSIVNARSFVTLSLKPNDGKKTISISQVQDNMQCPSVSSNSNLVEDFSTVSEEYIHETPYINAKMIENHEKFDLRGLNSEQAYRFAEFNRINPQKKRKKTKSNVDGCKRCNCKRTKCLKLYCDCFAAGIYCSDSCSCQGCFNKPEHVDTVLETRQQIESRNPHAFAPKIVPRLTQPPESVAVEDSDQVTPLVGRHKRGCNCKKSMCLKKYCECYQANVGCSIGCRCEGCQNIYGLKGASGMYGEIDMEFVNEKINYASDDKHKVISIRSRSSLSDFQKPTHNLTPQTPSFPFSKLGKDASKSQAFPGRYILSPESECTFNGSYLNVSSGGNTPDVIPFDQESYPNAEFMDEFSPSNSSISQLLLPRNGMNLSSIGFRGGSSSSSVTPLTLFRGTKQSFEITDDDDDTPKILKDSRIQHNYVIGTSPNKKRVSPPRIRLHELGSTSLKSGRKFILKAVSSFPPLTPCIDSKDITGHTSQGDNTR